MGKGKEVEREQGKGEKIRGWARGDNKDLPWSSGFWTFSTSLLFFKVSFNDSEK